MINIKDMTRIAEPVVDVNDISRISAGTVIKGEISSRTDIRIDGQVEGKIHSEGRIVVGEGALVKGALLCCNVDFWGKLEGDIYVKDTLTLKASSSVDGSISVRKFQVEMGAQFNGMCKMITEAEYDKIKDEVVEVKYPALSKKAPEHAPAASAAASPAAAEPAAAAKAAPVTASLKF